MMCEKETAEKVPIKIHSTGPIKKRDIHMSDQCYLNFYAMKFIRYDYWICENYFLTLPINIFIKIQYLLTTLATSNTYHVFWMKCCKQ